MDELKQKKSDYLRRHGWIHNTGLIDEGWRLPSTGYFYNLNDAYNLQMKKENEKMHDRQLEEKLYHKEDIIDNITLENEGLKKTIEALKSEIVKQRDYSYKRIKGLEEVNAEMRKDEEKLVDHRDQLIETNSKLREELQATSKLAEERLAKIMEIEKAKDKDLKWGKEYENEIKGYKSTIEALEKNMDEQRDVVLALSVAVAKLYMEKTG